MSEKDSESVEIDLSEWKDWQKDRITRTFIQDLKGEVEQIEEGLTRGAFNGATTAETGASVIKWQSYLDAIRKVISYVEETPEEMGEEK